MSWARRGDSGTTAYDALSMSSQRIRTFFTLHRQEYRLVDAATGEFERGYVDVADMADTQPWADDIPIHVRRSARAVSDS